MSIHPENRLSIMWRPQTAVQHGASGWHSIVQDCGNRDCLTQSVAAAKMQSTPAMFRVITSCKVQFWLPSSKTSMRYLLLAS